MKLEKLIIHNIASITDAEIDFTGKPLSDASLFLIDGETGSGKTTILDSICLALYGTTPRMKEANKEVINLNSFETDADNGDDVMKANDTKQLLRRSAVEGAVELYFIGNDDCHYLAKWEIRRSRNKMEGRLQTPRQSLQNLDTKTDYGKSELKEKIEKVVGLRFDQFCRTTMLAQGDFTRFLYSKEDEKADILEKLTGTEQYAKIGQMVYTIFYEVREKYNRQATHISMMTTMTDDEVHALESRLKEQTEVQGKLMAETEILSKQISWLKDYETKTLELRKSQAELEEKQAETQKESYKKETGIINDYNLSETARGDIRERDKAQKNLRAEKAKSANYKSIYFSLVAANERLKENIASRERNRDKLAKDVEAANVNVNNVRKSIEDKTKVIEGLKQSRDTLNPSLLNDERTALDRKISICNRAEVACNDVISARQTENDCANDLKAQGDSLAEKQKQLTAWKNRHEQVGKDYEIKNEVYEKLSQSVKDWAKEARRRLKVGDVCPVCGQSVLSIKHDEDFRSLLEGPEKERNEAKKSLDEAAANVKALQGNIRDLEKALAQYNKKAGSASSLARKKEKELADMCKDIEWMEYMSDNVDIFLDYLAKLRKAFEEGKTDVDKKLQEVARLNRLIEKENSVLVKLQNDLTKAERDRTRKDKAQQDNLNEIKTLSETLKSCDEMMASMKEILIKWHSAGNVQIRNIELNVLQASWTSFATDIAGWKKSLEVYEQAVEEKDNTIRIFLGTHPKISNEYLEDLARMSQTQINILKNVHKQMEDDIIRTSGAIATLKVQIDKAEKEKPAMQEGVERKSLEKILAEKKNLGETVVKDIAESNVRLANDKKLRKEKAEAEEILKTLKTNYEKWNVFNDLFGSKDGKKFKMIAESFILSHLLRLANTYLQQFTGRFSLACSPGSLVILVHDSYQGDKPFGSNTLSGGESFLVSLSLALGLSQLNTSRNAVDTLFIDEGFGTLDGDYLNAVMDALGKLHQIAGRRVGIISHVDILSTLIPTQIQVRKVNPTQSRIRVTEKNVTI